MSEIRRLISELVVGLAIRISPSETAQDRAYQYLLALAVLKSNGLDAGK